MGNERLNGELITRHRTRTGQSYEEIASMLGVGHGIVRAMEKGYVPRRDRDEVLKRLAKLLKVSVAALTEQVQVA